MTGSDPDRLQRRLRWAAEQLELRPDASPDEVRAAWLRQLPDEDFVPSDVSQWALTSLLRRPTEGGHEARADGEADQTEAERLRAEVETFAGQFWDVPPGERLRRWKDLLNRCSFAPDLKARLHLLEAGLGFAPVVSGTAGDAQVTELVGHVRALFVLRPGPRARARQSILAEMKESSEEWKTVVRRLRRVCPVFASLGNDLLDAIQIGEPILYRPSGKRPLQAATTNDEGKKSRFPIWVIAVILLTVGRACMSLSSKSTSPTPPSYSPYFKEKNSRFHEPPGGREDIPPALVDFNKKFKLRIVEDEDGNEKLIGVQISPDQKRDPKMRDSAANSEKSEGRSP